jgi:hypothetical protein
MAKIKGMLLSDLRPNGTVRISFIIDGGSGSEPALRVKDLDTAEADFVRTFGLPPNLASALRGGLERNKVFCLETNLNEEVAAMFFPA